MLILHSPSLSHLDHHQELIVLAGSMLFNIRDDPRLTREVIRSRYISTTEPDMTRVTVRLDTQPRVGATYTCTVYVEGRGGDFIAIGTGIEIVPVKSISTTVTVTGE